MLRGGSSRWPASWRRRGRRRWPRERARSGSRTVIGEIVRSIALVNACGRARSRRRLPDQALAGRELRCLSRAGWLLAGAGPLGRRDDPSVGRACTPPRCAGEGEASAISVRRSARAGVSRSGLRFGSRRFAAGPPLSPRRSAPSRCEWEQRGFQPHTGRLSSGAQALRAVKFILEY